MLLLAQPTPSAEVEEADFSGDGEDIPGGGIKLQKLSARHKQVLSLMAQGMDRQTCSIATKYTPEYVTWLLKQDICQTYLGEMVKVAESQLQAQFCKSVDVIGETLINGTEEGKLKAAKLQLEATGRVGKLQQLSAPPVEGDRLTVLAERLVGLLKQTQGRIVNGEVTDVQVEPSVQGEQHPERQGSPAVQGSQPSRSQSGQGAVRTLRGQSSPAAQ